MDAYGNEYGDYGDEVDCYGQELPPGNFGNGGFNPMAGGMLRMNLLSGPPGGFDPNMLANMMQHLSMNPQAVQGLIDPNDPKA